MRKGYSTIALFLAGAAMLAAQLPARAGTCFHVRAKCKVCWNTTKAEFIHPHTSKSQAINAHCFKSGCGLGFHVAEASAHASQHSNGNFHFKTWAWDAGFSSASAHASHGHCSQPAPTPSLCANEPRIPPRASTEGAFGFTELEASDVREGTLIRFLRGSHLQVDARGLVRSTDRSFSSVRVEVENASRASGRIELLLTGENGAPSLTQDGLFSGADLRVGRHPTIPGIFLVSLRDASATLAGLVAEDALIHVDMEVYHDGTENEGGKVSECSDE